MKVALILFLGIVLLVGVALWYRTSPSDRALPTSAVRLGDANPLAEARNRSASVDGRVLSLVEHGDLKDALPSHIAGFRRIDVSSEYARVINENVSRAVANYAGESNALLRIEITDFGAFGGLATKAYAEWINDDVQRETEHGFERSSMYKGYRALEVADNCCGDFKKFIWVADRFLVAAEGDEMTLDTLRAAVEMIDVDRLAKAKPAPPP